MEHHMGSDPELLPEVSTAQDTLNTVLANLSLLLLGLLLSVRAVWLQRADLTGCAGTTASNSEIIRLRYAAGTLVLPPLTFLVRLAVETWQGSSAPQSPSGCSARINAWASLLVLTAALLRYYDLTVMQPRLGGE